MSVPGTPVDEACKQIAVPSNFEDYAEEETERLRRLTKQDVFFTGPQDSGAAVLACFFKTMVVYNIVLPSPVDIIDGFWSMYKHSVVDINVEQEMTSTRALNWCTAVQPMAPLRTKGDGNCLPHALSLSMWGVDDSTLFLRRLLHVSLVTDIGSHYRTRWRTERERENCAIPGTNLNMSEKEYDSEWDNVVSTASDIRQPDSTNVLPYNSLEEIHIFVLANLLRRPILIICDSVLRSFTGSLMADNNLSGIYLPLLSSPQECTRVPLVIGYESSHFVPLVNYEDSHRVADHPESRGLMAVPLVDHLLHQLPVHFLTDLEQSRVEELKDLYLELCTVEMNTEGGVETVPVALLSCLKIFDDCDVLKPFFVHLEALYVESLPKKTLPTITINAGNSTNESDLSLQGMSLVDGSLCRHTYCTNRKIPHRYDCPECLQIAINESNSTGNTEPLLSMTGETCAYVDCNYIATQQYKPYCHEHASELHAPKEQRTISTQCDPSDITAEMIDKQTSTTESLIIGSSSSTSSSTSSKPSPKYQKSISTCTESPASEEATKTRCRRTDCQQVVTNPIRGYCHPCYVLHQLSSDDSEQTLIPLGRTACVTSGCPGSAKRTSNSGLCKDCKRKIRAQSPTCITTGCSGLRAKNSRGLCYYCLRDPMTSRSHTQHLKLSRHGSLSRPQYSRTDQLPPAAEVPTSSPAVRAHHGSQSRGTPSPPSSSPPPSCARCNCHYTSSQLHKSSGRCLNVHCDYYGTTENNGYCSACASIMNMEDMPHRLSHITKRPNSYHGLDTISTLMYDPPMDLSTRTAAAYIGQDSSLPCLNPSCPLFGDPNFSGYCQRCYRDHALADQGTSLQRLPVEYSVEKRRKKRASIPRSPSTGYQYSKDWLDRQTDAARVKTCLVPGCKLFGNVKCNGLCNTCYAKVKQT